MSNIKLNQIYHGDNLSFMESFPKAFIDLIYIDPPPFGTQSLWSSKAFKDSTLQNNDLKFYDIFGGGVEGYLKFINKRLRQMHRLLKPNGVLCVHLDWRVAHYVKIKLDEIFGVKNPTSSNTNFVNEIIWCYSSGGASKKTFSKKHDTILVYSKTKNYTFNLKKEKTYRNNSGSPIGKQKYFYDDGGKYVFTHPKDYWNIPILSVGSKERRGYPTQKPLKLLNKIIEAFTNEGDLIADFFCGCGTAIDSAQSLNRKWLGVDASNTACQVMQERMEDRHSLFVGIDKKPITYEDFKSLSHDKFEEEAVMYIGGTPNTLKVGDGGIDGRLAFDGAPIQVKKHDKKIGDDDRFRGFYEHLKKHGRGVYITLNGYTSKAKQKANQWRSEGLDIQLLSIQDILNNKFREQPLPKKVA